MNVILTAIGVYSVNTKDESIIQAHRKVQDIVLSHEHVKQMHGFYLLEEQKTMRFDVVISFDARIGKLSAGKSQKVCRRNSRIMSFR